MSEFFKVRSLEKAKDEALNLTHPVSEIEVIKTEKGMGKVLAKEVISPIDLPGFPRSRMDGYVVKSKDTCGAREEDPISLKVIGTVKMGEDTSDLLPLASGETMAISTGGMLPSGTDAVVMLEETEKSGGDRIDIFSPVAFGTHVTAPDEDISKGETIVSKGHRLKVQQIGALLGVGVTEIKVFKRVRVGILSTGDELISPYREPKPGEVRDINSYTLRNQIPGQIAETRFYGIIADAEDEFLTTVKRGIREQDLLLISGGSSVGTRDITLKTLERLGKVLIHGLQMAPGKPTIFALIDSKPVIGLPGNPVSSMVVFDKFVLPIIYKISGWVNVKDTPTRLRARMLKNVSSVKGRRDFLRVILTKREDELYAQPIFAHSNITTSLSRADGLVDIPARSEGLQKDTEVVVELW